MPIELLRNISHFIDFNGLKAIKICFTNSSSDNLPLKIAHNIFNIIVNIRLWLNPIVIEQQIIPIRSLAIEYMCQLSDKDLRFVGAKNTTELMFESFKEVNNYYIFDLVNSSASGERQTEFKLDKDGLTLAIKYFMCSTLTIRLCGINQMNLQISSWSEYNSFNLTTRSNDNTFDKGNELADWFVANKIIEHLFGPNLHVEVSNKLNK